MGNRVKRSARVAALFFAIAGALAIVDALALVADPADRRSYILLGILDLAIALAIRLLPWQRWPQQSLLVIAPVSYLVIGLFATLPGAFRPYNHPVFFVLVAVWIGLSFAPRTSFFVAPLTGVAYIVPMLFVAPLDRDYQSVTLVLPLCVLISELLARYVARVEAAYAQLQLHVAELEQLKESLRQQTLRDPLTGLYNRRYLEEALVRELLRAQRGETGVAVLMLDIDYFKRINDTYGHGAGDMILKDVGLFLKDSVRGGDIPCRYGGEEFVIVLPSIDQAMALQRAEQLREGARQLRVTYQGVLLPAPSLSIGVALFPQHGTTTAELIRCADLALYRAKRQGRDRVELAEPLSFAPETER
jgi:diguanylate cyclase (GGDEF)-like protein